jgi:LPS export ABC transporter protein LptC
LSRRPFIILSIAFLSLGLGILGSCVNDLDSIQKITYNTKSPDDVTKNLYVFYNDSGYAKIELFANIAETYSKPTSMTQFKDGLKINFFDNRGKIASVLTALSGEINHTNGTMEVRDSVQLYNIEKKQRLFTEALFWNQRDSVIYTTSNVVIRSPQGIVYGNGIRTKQDFSHYEFLKPSGRIDFDKK